MKTAVRMHQPRWSAFSAALTLLVQRDVTRPVVGEGQGRGQQNFVNPSEAEVVDMYHPRRDCGTQARIGSTTHRERAHRWPKSFELQTNTDRSGQ